MIKNYIAFLSTPSARRATSLICSAAHSFLISIHALREEGDFDLSIVVPCAFHFYPRPPRGGRRHWFSLALVSYFISIHALREEGDCSGNPPKPLGNHFYPRPPRGGRLSAPQQAPSYYGDFYPRPPRGGRPEEPGDSRCNSQFLSTPSARRATKGIGEKYLNEHISIHALREEGDFSQCSQSRRQGTFLSTPSARRATVRF